MLDNARDAEQVRPLLPGADGCTTIITSRSQLSGLVVTEGAHSVTVEACTLAESREILAARIGARVVDESAAVDDIVALCGGLPLALAVVGARAALHPHFRITALASEIHAAHTRLDPFDSGEPHSDVRSAMSWSYEALTPLAARTFRTLGLHPVPDVTAAAAASMLDVSISHARTGLIQLAQAHLVDERSPGRFLMHDLLHAYARELSALDHESEQQEAQARIDEHYAYSASTAAGLLCRSHTAIVGQPRTGVHPTLVADDKQAHAWFRAEYDVLQALLQNSAERGSHLSTLHLGMSLATFLDRSGRAHLLIDAGHHTLTAAEALADSAGQTRALQLLARGYFQTGEHTQAQTLLRAALSAANRLDDRRRKASVLFDLGLLMVSHQAYGESIDHFTEALRLFRLLGDKAGQANALNGIGWSRIHLGEPRTGLRLCHRALDVHESMGNRHGQACTWDSIGWANHALRKYKEACTAYRSALSSASQVGDRYLEATILEHLGLSHTAAGDLTAAQQAWTQAITILDEIDASQAQRLRDRWLTSVVQSNLSTDR